MEDLCRKIVRWRVCKVMALVAFCRSSAARLHACLPAISVRPTLEHISIGAQMYGIRHSLADTNYPHTVDPRSPCVFFLKSLCQLAAAMGPSKYTQKNHGSHHGQIEVSPPPTHAGALGAAHDNQRASRTFGTPRKGLDEEAQVLKRTL